MDGCGWIIRKRASWNKQARVYCVGPTDQKKYKSTTHEDVWFSVVYVVVVTFRQQRYLN